MNVQIGLVITAVVLIASFVSYLIGRDVGEGKEYTKLMHSNERLLKENLSLKWENNRLNRAMAYYDDGVLRSILRDMDDGKMSGYGSYPDPE